jgi:NADH-quinone oxidoreductase subunit H
VNQAAVLVILITAVVVVFVTLTGFAYTTLAERKLLGRMQARVGPNRVGFRGMMQPLADVVKLIGKEDFMPVGANRTLFLLAPTLPVICAITALSLIPFGGSTEWWGYTVNFYGTDLSIGVLVLFALSGLSAYGLILGGWASGNKYSLLGAARTAAQLVSYEVALGLSIVGVIMLSGTLSLPGNVEAQADSVWYILLQPVGFLVFMFAAVAETNRTPFDLPEAEGELVAGYHTEYAGLRFAMFQMGEYVAMFVLAALGATLFLGGYSGPWLPGWLWLILKVVVLVFIFIWLRGTLPRLRYDRLMKLGWKVLIPVATANLVVTAIVVGLFFQN